MLRILLVDDFEIIREALAELCNMEGYKTCSASSVDEAASLLDRQEFDIAIIDENMPEKSGLQLVQIINDNYPSTKVYMMTGFVDEDFFHRTDELDIAGLFQKPLDFEAVIKNITQVKELSQEP